MAQCASQGFWTKEQFVSSLNRCGASLGWRFSGMLSRGGLKSAVTRVVLPRILLQHINRAASRVNIAAISALPSQTCADSENAKSGLASKLRSMGRTFKKYAQPTCGFAIVRGICVTAVKRAWSYRELEPDSRPQIGPPETSFISGKRWRSSRFIIRAQN